MTLRLSNAILPGASDLTLTVNNLLDTRALVGGLNGVSDIFQDGVYVQPRSITLRIGGSV
jgi:hypothetical protein